MWRYVVWQKCIEVSEEHTASIFRVYDMLNNLISAHLFLFLARSAYFRHWRWKSVISPEIPVKFYQTVRHHIPNDSTLHAMFHFQDEWLQRKLHHTLLYTCTWGAFWMGSLVWTVQWTETALYLPVRPLWVTTNSRIGLTCGSAHHHMVLSIETLHSLDNYTNY
jgi:hypothetical protein